MFVTMVGLSESSLSIVKQTSTSKPLALKNVPNELRTTLSSWKLSGSIFVVLPDISHT